MLVEGSFDSLVQGVSQQHVLGRLPGQHEQYLNMICDPVTGPRRRSGTARHAAFSTSAYSTKLRSWRVELGGIEYDLFLDADAGTFRLFNSDGTLQGSVTHSYFEAADAQNIDLSGLREDLWVCNTEAVVGLGALSTAPALLNPEHRGFYWVRAAAFSKRYDITLNVPGTGYSYSWDTPDGTGAGDAALSTPEKVATELATAINLYTGTHGVTATRVGPVLYFSSAAYLNVTTSSGELYVRESKLMRVPAESDLPPYMPSGADGVVCTVGNADRARVYFYWSASRNAWVECGAYGSNTKYTNTPRRLYMNAGTFSTDAPEFPSRLSGDDYTNPYLPFSAPPYITGMSTYQGRLVLLSGGVTNLSAALTPTQFSRSTVTALLDSDPVSVTNSGLSAAKLRHALQYNRDLLVFSGTHQAVLPGGTAGITPRNPLVVLTGNSVADMTTPPAQVGQWAVFSTPSGAGYSGFSAITPSQYTSSQYRTDPMTEHLPRYFPGTLRNFVSSGAGGFAFAHHDGAPRRLQVYKYLASPDGSGLGQSAWQEWEFPLPIATLHAARDTLVVGLLAAATEEVVVCTMNYRLFTSPADAAASPFLDLWLEVDYTGVPFDLGSSVVAAAGLSGTALKAVPIYGDLRGEPVGVEHVSGTTYRLHPSAPNGLYAVGLNVPAAFTPSPPLFRSKSGEVIELHGTQLIELRCTTRNSGEYRVEVQARGESVDELDVSPVLWSSAELVIGERQLSALEQVAIPVEELSATSLVTFYVDGTREFNPVQIDYTLKLRPPKRRRG